MMPAIKKERQRTRLSRRFVSAGLFLWAGRVHAVEFRRRKIREVGRGSGLPKLMPLIVAVGAIQRRAGIPLH
jgi:hypothetical protein